MCDVGANIVSTVLEDQPFSFYKHATISNNLDSVEHRKQPAVILLPVDAFESGPLRESLATCLSRRTTY